MYRYVLDFWFFIKFNSFCCAYALLFGFFNMPALFAVEAELLRTLMPCCFYCLLCYYYESFSFVYWMPKVSIKWGLQFLLFLFLVMFIDFCIYLLLWISLEGYLWGILYLWVYFSLPFPLFILIYLKWLWSSPSFY